MNTNPVDELPLLELFTRLREAGLPLGINEYQLVLRSLQAGFGIQDRAALAKLCRTLWIKSPEEERLFNHHFEQIIGHPTSTASTGGSLPAQTAQSSWWLSVFSKALNVFDYRHMTKWERSVFSVCLLILTVSLLFIMVSSLLPKIPFLQQFSPSPVSQSSPPSNLSTVPIPTKTAVPAPSAPIAQKPSPLSTFVDHQVSGLLSVTITIAISVIAWRVERRKQRQRRAQAADTIATNKLSTELIQQIGDEVRVARVVRRRLEGDGETGDRILTNPEFFPITRRQMKQSWRYLRRFIREGAPIEIDIDATIRRVGQQGLLLEPVLIPGRVNRSELLLLIDQDGSMVPFHNLSQRLIQTALQGGRLGNASVYYFHNCPTDYVYRDPVHQQAVAIDDFFAQLNPRTAVLIFSDAGSARGGFNARRRRATKTFLDDLKQHVRYVAWLNPMPRSRWTGTTAGDVAHVIPMFEVSRQGLDGAIDVLRGKTSKVG